MTTRIWYQSAVEMDGAGPYAEALRRHFARVAGPGTEVALHGVPPGTWAGRQPSDLFGYPAIFLAALGPAMLRNAVQAEREGFDAFVVATYIEPFLRELRAAVDIPVVSGLEASLLVGCSTGGRIGIVTLNRALLGILDDRIARHGLDGRVGPRLTIDPELTEAEMIGVFADPASWLARFRDTAARAAAMGAEVIVPAEGILAEVVSANGLAAVDGATVLDGIAVPVLYADMLARLARSTGWRPGRGPFHAKPPTEVVRAFVDRLVATDAPRA